MTSYLQAGRFLKVSTPLGADTLLLRKMTGREAISRPFRFHLQLAAVNGTDVPFDALLGARVTAHVGLTEGQDRHFSGVCSRLTEAGRDATFTAYRMEVVPEFWLLSLRVRSRIFQQVSVPDILKLVLNGLDVVFDLHGTFAARDYCVQYRESDFAFASRLMEEEGIYYFFKHTAAGHQLVVSNSSGAPDVPDERERAPCSWRPARSREPSVRSEARASERASSPCRRPPRSA